MQQVIAAIRALIRTMGSKKLRVLCFGDSLTIGYSSFGAIYHPYSETLEQMVAMALPEVEMDIVVDGRSGDMVRGGFYERIQKNCKFVSLVPSFVRSLVRACFVTVSRLISCS